MASFQVLNGKIMGGPVIPVESMKLLWSNPNPNAAFEAQNITLASEDYDFLLIPYKTYVSQSYCNSSIAPKGFDVFLNVASNSPNGAFSASRILSRTSDTSYSVDNAAFSVGTGAGTQDNNRIIPVAVYGIKKNSIGGGDDSHLMKYSTNEQIVGTWIDGKPIYQKVIQGTTNTTSDVKYFSVGAPIDKYISIQCMVYDGSGSIPFDGLNCNIATFGSTFSGIRVTAVNNTDGSNPNSLIIKASVWLDKPFIAIVQYTKTTD